MNAVFPLGNIVDIIPVIMPLDLQTARTGDWISLRGAQGVAFVFFKGAGTAADDPTVTLRQAQAVAGTGAKDLVGITTVYKKQHTTLPSVGVWTKVTQTAAATFVGDGTSAEEQGLYVIQVSATQLDIANDFDCVTVNIADTGTNAQLGCVLAILYGSRYGGAPENLIDHTID